ncbi:MAG TPA: HYR domain-containing protein [Nitrososphaeraceae archaeon]
MILEATGPGGRIANYNATARDIVDGNVVPNCNPPSGSEFPLGQTKLRCTATDKAGNIGMNAFNISVRDTTPPETGLGNVTVGWLGSITFGITTPSDDINFVFNGTDLVGIRHYECRLDGGSWQLGKTIVDISNNRINICTYTDLHEQGTHNFQVRAVDTSGNKDPNPPNFMWEIESPLRAVQELKLQVRNINSPINLESSHDQVIKVLSDRATTNDASSCYLLDSFMNEIKVKNLMGVLRFSDLDKIARTTLAIMDNIGCPPPIANAGSPQSVDAGTKGVNLDGSHSLYVGNDAKFSWKQIGGGPAVKLKNADIAKASFDAPSASQLSDNSNSVTLSFRLAVTGIGGLESTDTTTVQINPVNTPPVANSQSVTTTIYVHNT